MIEAPKGFTKYPRSYVGRELADWAINGCPNPPPQPAKVLTLAHLLTISGITRFVETGTLGGHTCGMIALMPGVEVDTIELSQHYYDVAGERLRHQSNIRLHLGDSAVVLPLLLADLEAPALFWLDAHCSGGLTAQTARKTPVSDEIEAILRHPINGHIMVLDDLSAFSGRNDYPVLDQLEARLREARPEYGFLKRYNMAIHAPQGVLDQWADQPFRMYECPIIGDAP